MNEELPTDQEFGNRMLAIGDGPNIPKPSRVEKWQRWRSWSNVYVIGNRMFDSGHWEVGDGGEIGDGILSSKYWTFLGYAKPDKVEVGQRWHWSGETFEVQALLDDGWLRTTNGWQTTCAALLDKQKRATYLGMADSAKPDVESVFSTMPNKSPSEFTVVPTVTTKRIGGDAGMAYRDREGVIAADNMGVERFITENYKRQFVTLSDPQRRTLRHMLLEQRAQSDEEPTESLQGIASKAKLGGTLDLSANECATVLDTMPAFEVEQWIEVADLLTALKMGREI